MHKHLLTSIAAAMLPLSAQGAIAQASGSYSYLGSRSRDAALSSAIHYSSQQSYNKLDDKSDTQLQVISAQHSLFLTPLSTSEKALDLTIQQHTQPDEILNADIERVNGLELVENYQVNELIIIDQAVPDKHLFYKALKPGGEIREIDSSKDGLEQLKAILANYQNLNALHIVSHADDGVVFLGSSNVNEELLREEVNTLATMNKAMKDGADVFFYGCNLAKSEKGEALLELIQGEANVDVAASNNLTGNMKQGGDWQLEIVKGDITSEQPFSDIAVRDFSHTLAPEVYTSGSFCVAGCGTPSTSLTSSDGHFVFTGNADGSGEDVHAYNTFRPDDGMYFDYQTSIDGDTTGLFNFAADGVTVGSFELTELVYSTYGGGSCSGGSVVGYVAGGGTVSNPLTWSGTNTSATLSNFSGVQITHFRVSGSGCTTSVYQGMGVRSFTVDNKQAPTDSDGSLTAAGTVSEPVAINTTVDSAGEAVDVFDFTLSDGGSSDGLAMGVSQIVLKVSGTTTDSEREKVTWRLNGNDVSNVTGVYNAGANTITFSGLGISVANSASEIYTVNAYYNDNTGITEGKTFVLSVDGDTDLTVGSSGTQMAATSAVTNGAGGTFDVTASALVFSTQPSGSVSGSVLTTQPVIVAQDAFGNTDIDFTETVTLTEASAGSLINGSVAAVSGVATFTNVVYTATADQQSFTLTANDQDGVSSNLAMLNANAVTADVVATKLVFNTQPVPLSVNSGEATNFSTVPVVSARDGNNVIDTGYSTGITLTEVNGAGSAIMAATGDTDGSGATVTITPSSGVSTFTSMQITYTAAGGSNENFNLQASSGGLATVNSSQFTGVVDSTPPTVTSVSSNAANGSYKTGDVVAVAINFSESVVVTGTPQLILETGAIDGTVNYSSGSGSSTLIFSYTVQSGDSSSDLDYVATNSLSLNSGTIKDGAGNAATLTLATPGAANSLGANKALVIDGAVPTVSSVTVPANATYIAGQNLDFNINFAENVTVDTTGGTPQLSITVGATTRQAVYVTGSGTGTLLFRYTIQAGESDSDGIAIGTLSANGATLRDAALNSANLTLNSVGATTAILVDTVVPTVSSVNVPANATYIAGQNLDFTINFSENVTVDTTGGTPQLAITVGATTRQAVYVSGSGTGTLLFRYTIQAGESDTDGIAIGTLSANGGTLRDAASNDANVSLNSVGATTSVLVDAAAPSVTSVSVPANATYIAGQNLDFTINFAENIIVDTAGGTPQLAIIVGATTRQAVYASGTGTNALSFRYTIQTGDSDSDGIAIGSLSANGGTLRDAASNNTNVTLNSVGSTTAILVDAIAPTVAEITAVTTPGNNATPNVTISTNEAGTLSVGGSCGSANEGSISSGNNTISLTQTDNSTPLSDGTYSDCTITITDSVSNSNTPITLTTFVVDATAPSITSVTVPANATYTVGQKLDFTVNFAENVTVGGTPQLSITIGSTTRQATYQSGSGTNALLFSYTVQAGENDSDGIAVGTLSTNGGTIIDAASNNATLTLNSTGSTTSVLVDALAPTTTSVIVPNDATYTVGQNLDFTVNFNENVTVNTVGGTPQLTITIGSTARQASYLSGSGTGALLFRYTVQAGESDNDGIAIGNLAENGGTIKDASSNTAALNLNSVGATTGVLVDSVDPIVAEVTAVLTPNTDTTPNVTISTTKAGNLSVGGSCGSTEEGLISSGNTTISLTQTDNSTELAQGTYSDCTITVTDPSGNTSAAVTLTSFTINTTATISGASYDASTGVLNVSAGPMITDDNISVSRFTLMGEGKTHTLTSADVVAASSNHFLVTLNDEDKAAINLFMNKNGSNSTDNVAYNIAALDDWNSNTNLVDAEDSISPVLVSNVAIPKIVDANYNASTGVLTVSATDLLIRSGDSNDIVTNKFSLTAEGGVTYTLTNSANVEVSSGNTFSITLSEADKAELNKVMNKNGTSATDATVYNLAAAEDWIAGADSTVVVADITDNAIDVSNVNKPTISEASYDASTGILVVTGTGYLTATGSANDITANAFVFTGQGGGTYALVDTANVDISSATSFTLTLSATDKVVVNQIINKTGTLAIDGTAFNLAANNDWNTGADEAIDIADVSDNTITASVPNSAPVIEGTPSLSVNQGYDYNFTPTASDFNEDELTFSIVNKPNWASFDETTGILSGVPGNADVGSTSAIVITVSDGDLSNSLAAFDLIVLNVNDAPVINGIPSTNVLQDAAYSFTPSASDIDVGSFLSFSITNQPSWTIFNAVNGELTGTPDNSAVGTTAGIIITVSDGMLSSSLPAFSLTVSNVNDAPVITGSPATQIDENSAYHFQPTISDIDVDDILSFTVSGTPEWMSFDSSTGTLTGTPIQQHVDMTSNITITVNDNSGANNATDSFSFSVTVININQAPEAIADNFELSINKDNTYVLNVLSNDTDIDGDVLSIIGATTSVANVTHDSENLTVKTPLGFTGTIELLYTITDGNDTFADGSATLLIKGDQDSSAPIITVPANIEVNATGLYTKVNLGVATALNSAGKPIAITLVESNSLFKPGKNIAYWQATDPKTGLTSIASQQVLVHPLISLGKNQTVVEGKTATVKVLLNGQAVSYPLVLTLNVSGSATMDDYAMDSQTVTIESGTQANVMIDILQDNESESIETLTLSIDEGNVGTGTAQVITIVETNVSPVVSLVSSQNNERRQIVTSTDSLVTIEANISDANDDNVSTQWLYDNILNIEHIDDKTIELNPDGLSSGVYSIDLIATDNGDGNLSTTRTLYLSVVNTLPELTDSDTDSDRIPDNEEGHRDTDDDGIPNYLDSITDCNVMPSQALITTSFLIESEPGTCLRKGNTLVSGSTGGLQLLKGELESSAGVDNEAVIVGGIFDYIATGLPEAGAEYKFVIPQVKPIPSGAVYRKHSENLGWSTFVEDAKNQLHSAPGTRGYCPSPNSAQWSSGLTEGHWCVRLTIEDGGYNDNDGIANASIIDPGGVSVMLTSNTAPVAVEDVISVRRNEAILIDVLANDTDTDQDMLTITAVSATFGLVTITSDNLLHYQSASNYVGQDTVVYNLSDGNGGSDSNTVSVTIYPNNAPLAVNDSASTDDRTAITIDVLANDSDIDGDDLTIISAVTDNGTVSISQNNTLLFTPEPDFDGVASITYIIDDGEGDQATAEAAVTIKAYQSVTVSNKSKGGSMGIILITLAGLTLYRLRRKQGVTKNTLIQGITALSLATSLNVAAAEPVWFVSGSIGQSNVSSSQTVPNNIGITDIAVDKSDTSYNIGAGINYDAYTLTLSYEQLGETSVSYTGDTLDSSAYHQALVNSSPKLVDGFSLLGQYTLWQNDDFSVLAGLGLFAWELDHTSKLGDNILDTNKDGVDVFYNLQLAYTVIENTQVFIKASRYNLSINNVNNISLGLLYRF
ncbi:DUF4347 domain-containing protein [Colwellia echini]|uniref:DUF4347 domain-containing protein n=1 Tax=Colwellia echini TaxID=1982103 RepID=A0ABY3MY18_9GAMM|nr:DUF4347 domain-containing protein [Colwellia echini]TYK66123.1 DUF4347 domain-containing protein [Colwellia echini]